MPPFGRNYVYIVENLPLWENILGSHNRIVVDTWKQTTSELSELAKYIEATWSLVEHGHPIDGLSSDRVSHKQRCGGVAQPTKKSCPQEYAVLQADRNAGERIQMDISLLSFGQRV